MSQNQAGYVIRKGRVAVDGKTVTDPNFEVPEDCAVTFDKNPLVISEHRYFMLHKPAGYLCATSDGEFPSALQLFKDKTEEGYYYFANVLGPRASGLVLLSDDLRITKRIKAKLKKTQRVYRLSMDNPVSDQQLQQLATVFSQSAPPLFEAAVERLDAHSLLITQRRGGYQLLEDALLAASLPVDCLCLQQFGKIPLGDLAEGECIELQSDQFKV